MGMNDIVEFIVGLRAIRDYEDRPISDEDLNTILEAARWTGSSKNVQKWSFVVVTGRDRLRGLAEHGDFTQPVRDSAATIVLVEEPGGNTFDIGRAAQNIMLAARAVGVATCAISFHRQDDAREYLGLEEGQITRWGVSLGYPTPDAKPRKFGGRRSPDDVVHFDQP